MLPRRLDADICFVFRHSPCLMFLLLRGLTYSFLHNEPTHMHTRVSDYLILFFQPSIWSLTHLFFTPREQSCHYKNGSWQSIVCRDSSVALHSFMWKTSFNRMIYWINAHRLWIIIWFRWLPHVCLSEWFCFSPCNPILSWYSSHCHSLNEMQSVLDEMCER